MRLGLLQKNSCLIALILALFCVQTSAAWALAPTFIWTDIEYTTWWAQAADISVPLITQNNNPAALGFINEPGTNIIFGAGSRRNTFNLGSMSSGRVTVGAWFDEAFRYGIEVRGFGRAHENTTFNASSVDGNIPIINIPFYNVINSRESGLLDGLPKTESVSVSDSFQPLFLEMNSLYRLGTPAQIPIVLTAGLHYVHLNEKFFLRTSIYNIPQLPNIVLAVEDNFVTQNNFLGLQVGARTDFDYAKVTLNLATTLALGMNRQTLSIRGQSYYENYLQTVGLFAEPSNIGTYHINRLALMPQLEAKLSYHYSKSFVPFIAYDGIYLTSVLRPSEQIDRNINNSQNPVLGSGVLVGPASPTVSMHATSLWMQGVSLGVEFS